MQFSKIFLLASSVLCAPNPTILDPSSTDTTMIDKDVISGGFGRDDIDDRDIQINVSPQDSFYPLPTRIPLGCRNYFARPCRVPCRTRIPCRIPVGCRNLGCGNFWGGLDPRIDPFVVGGLPGPFYTDFAQDTLVDDLIN